MKTYVKKNINTILGVFLLLGPLLDLLTGLSLHLLKVNLTIGIIIRVLFLLGICYSVVFIFQKKKLLLPYLLIGIYCILYMIGMIAFKGVGLFQELQGLVKTFYFPILFLSLYAIKEEIRISKLALITTLFLYLFGIFVPTILGVGFKTYEITKAGTLGFFNSANEVGGIISLLTPIMLYIMSTSKKWIPRIVLAGIYLTVILMVGTKTPLLTLSLTIGLGIAYYWIYSFRQKKYKNIFISLGAVIVGVAGVLLILPKTNFYKNIETHLNYLKLDSITEVFQDKELIDHFIFSQRLTFFEKKAYMYQQANLYQKLFGIGYLKKGKATKMIEMDYFDIYYSHGLIGFAVFFLITLGVLYKILEEKQALTFERYMNHVAVWFIIFLSFFTGHILTAPAVSYIVILLILSLAKREKKDLLFAGKNMELGGIEVAQRNLIKEIDQNKYKVTLVLEEKKGELLEKIEDSVVVKECKVSNHSNILLRKSINGLRELFFKILNYQIYDYSCCYTTYSYRANKIGKIASKNNSIYVHSDYSHLYKKEEEFRQFFDSRKVWEYKTILFVSQEAKDSFLKHYPELEEKTKVFNNFIDVEDIKKKSKEKIGIKKNPKNTLFVFVGRLDDSSKKVSRAIHLIQETPNSELWIVGDGPDRKQYEKEAKSEERIHFLGKKENPYPYMKEADYILLTSDYEGFPVTYLEALALQKSILTTIPTSDESIDIKDYAVILSKEEKEMIKQVKNELKKPKKHKTIDIEKIQKKRMKCLEELWDEEVEYA